MGSAQWQIVEKNQFSVNGLDLLWVTINPTQIIGGGKD